MMKDKNLSDKKVFCPYDLQQVEGAADKDGRTPSIWDVFAHAGLVSIITFA